MLERKCLIQPELDLGRGGHYKIERVLQNRLTVDANVHNSILRREFDFDFVACGAVQLYLRGANVVKRIRVKPQPA